MDFIIISQQTISTIYLDGLALLTALSKYLTLIQPQ